MITIGQRLDQNRGIGLGFDALRILLAVAIFYGHSLWVAGGNASMSHDLVRFHAASGGQMDGGGWSGPKRPLHVALVPMFFALSGFLVIGSAIRLKDVRTFLAFRMLRLFPALLVEVTLSALVLGPAVTSLNFGDYFRDPTFWHYFGNCLGIISFNLPGVFLSNPVANIVNINLWTLPSEFDCYFIMAMLMVTGLISRRKLMTIIFSIIALTFLVLNTFTQFGVTPTVLAPHTITFYFVAGAIFYMWRDVIPLNWLLFILSSIASYTLLMFQHTVYLAAPFVVYCMAFIGLIRFPKIPFFSTGDYSYGIYLYGFPISQAVVHFIPWVHGRGWANVMTSLLLSCLFAAFSWHVIEKRALKLKKYLPAKYFPVKVRVMVTPTEVVSMSEAMSLSR